MTKRPYELRVRAERLQETRERIVRATAELHEELGPAGTTVAEIARRAKVQRLTVYNHFPDEAALFPACKAHWEARNPLPDLGEAFAHEDPRERVAAVLRAVYGWNRRSAPMMTNMYRDRGLIPALDALMRETVDVQIGQLADALAGGFGLAGDQARRLRALLMLALDFACWLRLSREGLEDSESAALLAGAVAQLAAR